MPVKKTLERNKCIKSNICYSSECFLAQKNVSRNVLSFWRLGQDPYETTKFKKSGWLLMKRPILSSLEGFPIMSQTQKVPDYFKSFCRKIQYKKTLEINEIKLAPDNHALFMARGKLVIYDISKNSLKYLCEINSFNCSLLKNKRLFSTEYFFKEQQEIITKEVNISNDSKAYRFK